MQERGLTRAEMKQAQRLDIDLFYEKPPAAERKSRGREDPVVVFNPMLSHPPPRAPAEGLGPTPAAAAAAAGTAPRISRLYVSVRVGTYVVFSSLVFSNCPH